ncbi:SET and MYND domain-containing protein 5-like [Pollicipes pollicipes]|uniref:SET and MYND domain-containing protein 5-like n=1 Tax=Pollicipes pollicipes TaxID=41117 RepID=UPI001884CDB0|nr:SET and MYND domain-containing protein 5-like [Pollicipes pollicipes]
MAAAVCHNSANLGEESVLNGVEVRNIDESIGKGLFATRDFKSGDVIFEERPLVCCQFLWNAAYGYLACDFCMRPLETAEENARRLTGNNALTLPHPECCGTKKEFVVECPTCDASYCCEACRDAAWSQYHKTLCTRSFTRDASHPLVILQETWKKMHYPPETACIMLVARMLATVRQAADTEGAVNLFMQFCHRTVNEEEEIAHKMLGVQFSDQLETLRKLMSDALYTPDVHQWLTPAGFRSLIALVGTNGQGVGTSAISVWVRNCTSLDLPPEEQDKLDEVINQLYEDLEKEAGCFLNNEGSALYPLQSSCNHSCTPNAMPGFPCDNFHLVMSATQDIAAGEQICVSYLDECALERSRHSRSKILRGNYLFNCQCGRCQAEADQPDVTSEEEMDEEDEDGEEGQDGQAC